MKKLILTAMFAATLSGCATPYQPYKRNGIFDLVGGGYTEFQVNPRTYRIAFIGNSSVSTQKARDYTLLRAAELSIKNGYSYFSVNGQQDHGTISTMETQSTATSTISGDTIYTTIDRGQTLSVKSQNYETIVTLNNKGNGYNSEMVINQLKSLYGIE